MRCVCLVYTMYIPANFSVPLHFATLLHFAMVVLHFAILYVSYVSFYVRTVFILPHISLHRCNFATLSASLLCIFLCLCLSVCYVLCILVYPVLVAMYRSLHTIYPSTIFGMCYYLPSHTYMQCEYSSAISLYMWYAHIHTHKSISACICLRDIYVMPAWVSPLDSFVSAW